MPAPALRFTLTPGERQTTLWLRLHAHFTAMLTARREQNDFPRSEPDTARLRGEIALLKELLDLNTDRLP
jgi:hypothetical protein